MSFVQVVLCVYGKNCYILCELRGGTNPNPEAPTSFQKIFKFQKIIKAIIIIPITPLVSSIASGGEAGNTTGPKISKKTKIDQEVIMKSLKLVKLDLQSKPPKMHCILNKIITILMRE